MLLKQLFTSTSTAVAIVLRPTFHNGQRGAPHSSIINLSPLPVHQLVTLQTALIDQLLSRVLSRSRKSHFKPLASSRLLPVNRERKFDPLGQQADLLHRSALIPMDMLMAQSVPPQGNDTRKWNLQCAVRRRDSG